MQKLETTIGPTGRLLTFIAALSEAGQRGDFSIDYKVGIKQQTLEPAIGLSIDGGEIHPFTVAEAKQLAALCEETLNEGDYCLIAGNVEAIIRDLREAAAKAEDLAALVFENSH